MALSTQPYKGARDFYPDDKRLQKYMFATLRRVIEMYGYEEYDAPILEPLDIYLAKTGDEIVNEQTYVFEDRGGRSVVIRPEMTPTISRMVAAKRQELAYPLRWYSIPNLWRYERPQKGRLREHWQLNVDIFGIDAPHAEVELLSLIDDIYKAFGAAEDMYSLRVNDRQLVNFVLRDFAGFNDAQAHDISKLIDKMHKIERSKFLKDVDAICTLEQRENGAVERLLQFLDSKNIDQVKKFLSKPEVTQQLEELFENLRARKITSVRFDPTIMRGFDYYTGIVFEAFDENPVNPRSMLGGGRYDGLVGMFGVEPIQTAGFGLGDVVLENFLMTHHLIPDLKSETDVYIALVEVSQKDSDQLVQQLRSKGLNTVVDYSKRKLGAQLKTAEKKGVRYVAVIGETELSNQTVNLKDLSNGNTEILKIEDVVKKLHK